MDAWQGNLRGPSPKIAPGKTPRAGGSKPTGSSAQPMSRRTSSSGAHASLGPPPRRSERLDEGASGYAMSPLADLHRAYLLADDESHSLFDRVNAYRGKLTIDKRDILDRGYDSNAPDRPRFVLKDPIFQRLSSVVTLMQAHMEAVASVQNAGASAFVIDPEKLMMPILSGTNSRFELDRAWNVVITRLSRAHDKFVNYVHVAQGKSIPNAPSSTAASVLERVQNNKFNPDEVFNELYRGVPSLRGQLSKENVEALQRGENLRSRIHSPVPLREAFPDRFHEVSPAEHYYDAEGGRIINAPHDPDAATALTPANPRRATFASPPTGGNQPSRPSSGLGYDFASARGREKPVSTPFSTDGSQEGRNNEYEEEENYYDAEPPGRYAREPPDLMHGSASAFRPPSQGYDRGTLSGIHALPYASRFRNQETEPRPTSTTPSPDHHRICHMTPGYPGGDGGSPGGGNHGGGPPHRPFPSFPPNGPAGRMPANNNGPPGGGGYGPPGGGGYGPPGGGYGPPGGGGNGPPGGGYGPPGGGGNGPPGGGGNGPPAAGGNTPWNYGQRPFMKTEVKPEQLPSWDSEYDTAVQYFFEIQEIAALGGDIPDRMGFWLWKRFKEGSSVADWYAGLTSDLKAHMRSHYTNFVDTIQRYFLGAEWKQYIQLKYENQHFRQTGHDKESPHQFIMRRILYTRMLLQVPPDSASEVYYICAKNPVTWASLLNKDTIADTASLQLRTRELHDALVDSWSRSQGGKVVTKDNLLSMLQQAGYHPSSNRSTFRSYRPHPKPESSALATAHVAEAAGEGLEFEAESLPPDDAIIHQVYATMQRQPPPSRRGPFPFDKCDHVHTTLGKRPAWPCKACGSSNHWDKECPMYDRMMAKVKKALWVEKEDPGEDLTVYTQVYIALLENIEESQCVEREEVYKLSMRASAQMTDERNAHRVEVVEDEDDLRRRAKIEAIEGLGFDIVPNSNALPTRTRDDLEANRESNFHSQEMGVNPDSPKNESPTTTQESTRELPPPPKDLPTFKVARRKKAAPGQAAMGTSVLSMRGKLGSLDERTIDLRLDSGADVSLVSKEFLQTLKNKVPISKGMKMRLWQLTDRNACLEGYTTLPVFVESEDGTVVETEVEAYVVPGMSVDVLLGEDYQLNHEVTVARDLEKGTRVSYRSCPHSIPAIAVGRTKDFDRMSPSHISHASYVRAKQHRRSQARKYRKRRKFGEERKTIRAQTDLKIAPNSVASLRVEGYFDDEREWLVEKSLLANADDSFFAIPNVLFSASFPVVPVMNPTDRPRYIRKGEAVGIITDPAEFLDSPKSEEHRSKMEAHAACLASMVQTMMEEEDGVPAETSNAERSATDSVPLNPGVEINETAALLAGNVDDGEADKDTWGPKTAEMPDPTEYSSADMEKLLDVGSLPEELKERAWAMLKRREKAFAFDGRLGHHPSKVHIRTVDGQVPISVPMYNSSPAKKIVIEEQLKKWFELGVIEASKSPWSAPVVIAYRNGKARFCVDYRKLNAVTIPDEFPIPRQSEILSALSGAQVLSCLDALAGFTQLEFSAEEVEKTAFRTHMGLFQFRRMPFGLRNGPSIFQRVMNGILAPYLWLFALVYIDDIVVYSKSYEEHIDHLDAVLGAIEKSGITLAPTKCHLFYSSILLLGHKVSRLGLSTHDAKVQAIMELQRPTRVTQLQAFLGMIVYFSAFIPFYAGICAPLFQLLRKGAKWDWGAEHEHAFEAAKAALAEAPVLGHPIQGSPYRLYTDASDEALGCALQQVQPIQIKDLKNTRIYDRLRKAYDKGEPVPSLVTKYSDSKAGRSVQDAWAEEFEETVVHAERVIGYWSRSFKPAERNYSTTEREALGAKEGLVKFQPFIEGEDIILVTDHSALQWARTYEHANRRLAAWGAVYSVYAPGLEIVHRAGRIHSNVDPLSRLPRAPPEHHSPVEEMVPAINTTGASQTLPSNGYIAEPARRATFIAYSIEDCIEGHASAFAVTRAKKSGKENQEEITKSAEKHGNEEEETFVLWEASNPPPNIQVSLDAQLVQEFVNGYKQDEAFKNKWKEAPGRDKMSDPGLRFYKDDSDLLFFRDANYQPRLCVPKNTRNLVLREAHDQPYGGAHTGPERLWQNLSSRFYWPRMKVDIIKYCETCDTCQKTKNSNFRRFGLLIPNPIPSRPYESISMDFVVNLPWSEESNAILVVVDRLTKHAQFIPCTTGLDAEGFAYLFVKHVAARFGLPTSIISDRDPRWISDFWRAICKCLKTKLALSSSHHPQHDGQTESTNKTMEVMTRAYTADRKDSWAEWLSLLEFSYNNTVHSSTLASPYFLLYGYEPRAPLDFLNGEKKGMTRQLSENPQADDFLAKLNMHRESARNAIAKAQAKQARSYNKGRRVVEFEIGSLVLVNPHSLEWIESKGEGAKLVQRWIGPFEVTERINPKVYRLRMSDKYPGSPVFNVDHLKRYAMSPTEFGERDVMPETRALKKESEEYEVESLIGHKFDKRTKKHRFLVRWKGYNPHFDSWVSERDLKNAPALLREYKSKHLD